MLILGIETSCDETSAAIIKAELGTDKVELLSNVVASSLVIHAKTGGIIPENAAREQVRYIIPVINESLDKANLKIEDVDNIAVTVGPGLIGSLLVGVETAKTFGFVLSKPIIPVNHLFGHIYANWVKNKDIRTIRFPVIALVVSGGHTDLVLIKKHGDLKWLGGTRDDAAGEAFDKTARLLGLPYPGGPFIEKSASSIDFDKYKFPRPLKNSNDFDFSFSGLKTAVLREIQSNKKLDNPTVAQISYSLQNAIFDVLISKTLKASKDYKAKSIVLGGGVASNQTLRKVFDSAVKANNPSVEFFIPEPKLCTDNAAMIATAGFFNKKTVDWKKVSANPELYFN